MKHEDYIITTTADTASRKFVWDAAHSIELDFPHGWSLEKVGDKFRLRDLSFRTESEQIENSRAIDMPKPGQSMRIELPKPHKANGRPIQIEITTLKSLPPAYNQLDFDDDLQSKRPRQLSMYYGQRYYLIRYRPVSAKNSRKIPQNAFSYERSDKGYLIESLRDGFQIKIGDKKTKIPAGYKVEISEKEFLSSTFIMGVQWWRFRTAPTPDDLPPVETADSEIDALEKAHLKRSAITVLIGLFSLSAAILIYSYFNPPPAKKIVAEVTIKLPKVIPPLPPPPPKVEKKKPVPPAKKIEPKKPEPVKKPAPPAQKPKPKAAVAPPAKAPPKPVVKNAPPPASAPAMHTTGKPTKAPSTTKADQLAKQKAAEQTQALQSLSFLTTSSKKAAAPTKNYDEEKTGRFSNTPTVGGEKSTSNVLDNIAKGAPGDGNIKTRSSREIVSKVGFGSGKGKGLNDVQGKVSLNDLAGAGSRGESLGSGSGMELSGAGEISESEIEKALAKFLSRFQYCYEKALLSDAGLGGNVVIQWEINVSGRSQNSRVVKSQLNNASLHRCITGVLGEVPFPKPRGGSVVVKKTFSFSSSSL